MGDMVAVAIGVSWGDVSDEGVVVSLDGPAVSISESGNDALLDDADSESRCISRCWQKSGEDL